MSNNLSNDLSHFPLAEYRFHFNAQEDFCLPAYTGSAWRGLFGHALKRTVCVTHEKHCQNCLLWQQCVYSYVFETPPPEETKRMRRYNAAPHPFVIRPDPQQVQEVKKGDSLFIDLVLIGRANQHLPYIIHTMQQIGKRGIGFQRGKFALQFVEQHTAHGRKNIYQVGKRLSALPVTAIVIPKLPQGNITLHFLTPFRGIHQGHLVLEKDFRFHIVISLLMRRFSLLSYFHTEQVFQPDFTLLIEQAKKIEVKAQSLHWHHWQRYSSRQKTTMKMGGLVGSIELAAEDLSEFWQMLVLGQYTHVGKVTVMGLGHYCLQWKQ